MSLKQSSRQSLLNLAAMIVTVVAIFTPHRPAFAQQGGAARYFYDANGRLTTVLSPTGEAAIYSYDPAGNFTSITRRAANELSIIDFTPGTGGANTQVVIYGTGFNPVASANTVKFNGVSAAVNAAANTQLTVTVPSGATTGPINVTNSNGSITSDRNFFVASSAVEFSQPILFGESRPFIFAHPGESLLTNVGALTFDGIAGQRISLLVDDLLPCIGRSHPETFVYAQFSVISPSGSILTTVPMRNYEFLPSLNIPATFAYLDPLVLPATGMYTILIDPFDAIAPALCNGRIFTDYGFGATAHLYDVPPDITGTIAASGLPTPVSFNTPGQNAVLSFSGLNGQRICLRGTQDIPTLIGTDVKVFGPGAYPNGTPIISEVITSSFLIEATTLTANGTYTILVDPQFNKTRTAVLTLYDVPPDITGNITIGGPKVNLDLQPGQRANLSFNVATAQSISILLPDGNPIVDQDPGASPKTRLSIINSFGTTVYSNDVIQFSGFIPPFEVPSSLPAGSYTLRVDPLGTAFGKLSAQLIAR